MMETHTSPPQQIIKKTTVILKRFCIENSPLGSVELQVRISLKLYVYKQ